MQQSTLKAITIGLGVLILLWGVTGLYLIFDARGGSPGTDRVRIEVREGASLSEIADTLFSVGIIADPMRFKMAARLSNRSRAIFPGLYELERNLSNQEALERLSHARAREVTVTIPEGLRSDEIIHILVSQLDLDSLELTALLTEPVLLTIAGPEFTHLEGTLFPDTYRFLENSAPETVLRRMVQNFRRQILPEWELRAVETGHTWLEIVTLASLIEKETALATERKVISSVYHNRLTQKMHLNCDPTLIYMLVQRGEWDGDLRRDHKVIRNRYNTYWYRGLPPGPIANPGLASLEAALYPDSTDYLYFVGMNDGTGAHDFSVTQRDHINKVNRYQRRRAGY